MNKPINPERDSVESTDLFAISDIRQNLYDHGGCRIYFEKGDKRDLICDAYQDEAFSVALRKFVEDYYANSHAHRRD
jgi:cytochrome c biogenesis protein ResB